MRSVPLGEGADCTASWPAGRQQGRSVAQSRTLEWRCWWSEGLALASLATLIGACVCACQRGTVPVGDTGTSASIRQPIVPAAPPASNHGLVIPAQQRRTGPDKPPGVVGAAGSATPIDGSLPPGDAETSGSQALAASAAAAVRFAVIGDFGDGSVHEAAVSRLVRSWNPEFVITTGDDNYPIGEASTIDAHIGAFYADFIGDYRGRYGRGAATNRFWPTPGNHDWFTPGLGPYLDYFTLPGNERYYDVEHGLVHLFALDSDLNEPDGTTPGSVQGRWAREKLVASRRCFKVVYFHHPPFSSGPHGDAPYMQWPFRAWGADVVLTGHDHIYERFQIDGIPYFVNGLGGATKYSVAERGKPGSVFRYNRLHGAMLVTAMTDGITYEFWNVEGAKVDELKVPKHCP